MHKHVYLVSCFIHAYIHIQMYLPNPSILTGWVTRSTFKRCFTGLNSEFVFSLTGRLKNLVWPTIYQNWRESSWIYTFSNANTFCMCEYVRFLLFIHDCIFGCKWSLLFTDMCVCVCVCVCVCLSLSMFLSICIYLCFSWYKRVYMRMCVCVWVCVCLCVCVLFDAYVHVFSYIYIYIYVCVCVCVCVCARLYLFWLMYTHTRAHTYTHAHTHAHARLFMYVPVCMFEYIECILFCT